MKKKIVLGLLALAAVLLTLYGRDLMGFYYLLEHVEATTEAYEAEGPWPHVADSCYGCHGANGNSQNQRYPSLAGQPAGYLTGQLQSFASGRRNFANMQPLAMTLSEAQISSLAAYFERQTPLKNQWFRADPQVQKKGEALAASGACVACHGEKLMGQMQFPRLAGQGYDYLLAQLDAFAADQRIDPTGSMKAVTANLSADDRKALAHYLAALAPANK
jgi:cytochrome c553